MSVHGLGKPISIEFESDRQRREAMEKARERGRLAALADIQAQVEAQAKTPSKVVRDIDKSWRELARKHREQRSLPGDSVKHRRTSASTYVERGFVEQLPQWLLDDNAPHPYDDHAADLADLHRWSRAEGEHRGQKLQRDIETRQRAQRAQQGRWQYQGAQYG